jgi:hypothetical protein
MRIIIIIIIIYFEGNLKFWNEILFVRRHYFEALLIRKYYDEFIIAY